MSIYVTAFIHAVFYRLFYVGLSYANPICNLTKAVQSSKMTILHGPDFVTAFTQSVFTCSKLPIESVEQGVKYVQS